MRVLVTRPRVSAERTANKLTRLGHEPVILPLTEARHVPEQAFAALNRDPGTIVFTSAEALRAISGLDLLQHHATPVYAVGTATAQEVRHHGFTHVHVGEGTGASLASLLVAHRQNDILYLAGNPRTPDLERELTRANISFTTVVCYEMLPLVWTDGDIQALGAAPDAVLLYSSEAARHFNEQPSVKNNAHFWRNCRALCLSLKVAHSLGEAAGMAISIAKEPTEESLLALLS